MKQDYPWIPMHYQEYMEDLEIPRKIQSEDCGDNLPKGGKERKERSIKRKSSTYEFLKLQPF